MPELPLPHRPLTDEEITLRPWHGRDATALTSLAQDAAIVRWTGVPANYDQEQARAWVARTATHRQAGLAVYFAVVDARSDELLGSVDLRIVASEGAQVGEIGYLLWPHARGRGVMTRAVSLIARWAFGELGIARVQILVHPDNQASLAVPERAGFTREGLLRSWRGPAEDRVVYSLLPDELA